MHLDLSLGKRHLALFLGSIGALVVLAVTPQLLGDRVGAGIEGLSDASAGLDLARRSRLRRLAADFRQPAGDRR